MNKKKIVAAAGLVAVYNYMLKRKNISKWVKNWIANRNVFGHMSLLRELSDNEPNDLKKYLRMTASDFNNLLGK
jgi:hypothetical protein